MYLTAEEFMILQGLKQGFCYTAISEQLGSKLVTCDPRIDSLCLKYGVNNRIDLVEKADLNKITVANIEEMPYWKYENSQLVQSIPICKKSLKNLLTLLEQVKDDKKEFKLIYSSNKLNKFLILERGTEKFYLYRQRSISPLSQRKPK